jgi:hypothetical protein
MRSRPVLMRAVAAAAATALLVLSPAVAHAGEDGGGEPVELETKQKNAGPHPVLRWSEVDGATEYVVAVTTPKGKPFWGATVAEPEVRFGGGPLDAADDSAGAALTKRMSWFVAAFGADGALVAVSAKRSIAP